MKILNILFGLLITTLLGGSISVATGVSAYETVGALLAIGTLVSCVAPKGALLVTASTFNLNLNTPKRPAAGVMSTQLISMQDFGTKPEIWNRLVRSHNDQYLTILHLARSMYLEMPIEADTATHYEEGWYISKFHSLYDIADPGAGNSATIYLTSADIDPDTNRTFPREGWTVFNALNESQSLILTADNSNPSAPFIVVKPLGSYSIGAIAQGQELSIGYQVSASGQGFGKSMQKSYLRRTSYIGLHKTPHEIQGSELANKRWFDYSENGVDLSWWNEAMEYLEYQHALSEENADMYGKTFDSLDTALTVPAGQEGEGNPYFTSKGVIPTIRDFGKLIPHTPGDFSMDTLYDLDTYWAGQGVGTNPIMCLRGNSLAQEMDKVFRAANAYTGVNFVSASNDEQLVGEWFNKNPKLAMSTEFNVMNLSNRKFMFHNYMLWSHPEKYATAGSMIPHQAIFIPLSQVTDPKTSETLPNFLSRYKAKGGLNRRYIFRCLSGVGAELPGSTLVNEIDKTRLLIMSSHGLQIQKANQLAMIDAVGA